MLLRLVEKRRGEKKRNNKKEESCKKNNFKYILEKRKEEIDIKKTFQKYQLQKPRLILNGEAMIFLGSMRKKICLPPIDDGLLGANSRQPDHTFEFPVLQNPGD